MNAKTVKVATLADGRMVRSVPFLFAADRAHGRGWWIEDAGEVAGWGTLLHPFTFADLVKDLDR